MFSIHSENSENIESVTPLTPELEPYISLEQKEYELREIVEIATIRYKRSVDAHAHTVAYCKRLKREYEELKSNSERDRADFTEQLANYAAVVDEQNVRLKELMKREATLLKNIGVRKVDVQDHSSDVDTVTFDEMDGLRELPIDHDDASILARTLSSDPLLLAEVDQLHRLLGISTSRGFDLSRRIGQPVYARLCYTFECWVSEFGERATYEELIRRLKNEKLNHSAAQMEKMLQMKQKSI